jgi:hypothetical protein
MTKKKKVTAAGLMPSSFLQTKTEIQKEKDDNHCCRLLFK